MSRLATPAEVLAVSQAGSGEVTREGLAAAMAMAQVARLADSSPEELRDWRRHDE